MKQKTIEEKVLVGKKTYLKVPSEEGKVRGLEESAERYYFGIEGINKGDYNIEKNWFPLDLKEEDFIRVYLKELGICRWKTLGVQLLNEKRGISYEYFNPDIFRDYCYISKKLADTVRERRKRIEEGKEEVVQLNPKTGISNDFHNEISQIPIHLIVGEGNPEYFTKEISKNPLRRYQERFPKEEYPCAINEENITTVQRLDKIVELVNTKFSDPENFNRRKLWALYRLGKKLIYGK